MLKEDIKLYVYKFSNEKTYFYFEQISEYIRKNNYSACIFNSTYTGILFILDKDFGNLLVVPNNKTRPFIGEHYKRFIGKYKKRSINTEHKVHTPIGKNGVRLIKHYSESIINYLKIP